MAVRRSAAPLDARSLFGEYPFLPGAEALLAEPVSLRALLTDPAYASARSLGRARALAAADDPRASVELTELSQADPDVRFLSFLFARVVLAAAPTGAALRRWAVAEAKRNHARLTAVSAEELADVGRRLGFDLTVRDGAIELPLVEYVRLAVPIREADFRLARQELKGGKVLVRSERAARLIQEAVRLRLAVPVPLADDVVAEVRSGEAELLGELARRTPAPVGRPGIGVGALRPAAFPPCIRKMQRTLQKGENLSHAGRFALAAFLHKAGADFETIVDAYRGAPDFDESITRYQVEHITSRDGGQGYQPPECDTIRSHGLCVRDGDPEGPAGERGRDALCYESYLRHPLQYYRIKGGTVVGDDRERGADRATPSAEGPGRPGAPERSRSTARR